MEDTLVPIAFFLMIGTAIWIVVYFRFRTRQELQLTIRKAVETGQSLSPAALEELAQALQPKKSDLHRGLIWLALALGLFVFSFSFDDGDAFGVAAAAAFPLFLGLAYFALWKMGSDDKQGGNA